VIFGSEVTVALHDLHQERIAAYTRQIDATTYRDIPALQARRDAAAEVPTTAQTASVDDDPDVRAAQNRFDAAERAYQAAERNVVCEKEGTCGSHRVGPGIAYKEKVAIRDDARVQRDEAQKALDSLRRTVAARLAAAGAARDSTAATTVESAGADLARLQAARDKDLADFTREVTADTGLLARLEALNELSATRGILRLAHLSLFLLFFSIELLPVLVKLLQVLGPETTYEQLVVKDDETARRTHEQDADARLRKHQSRLRVEGLIDRERRRLALAAGRRYVRKLGATQTAVIETALQAWSEQAREATDEALARWRHRLGVALRRPQDRALPSPPLNGHRRSAVGSDGDAEPFTIIDLARAEEDETLPAPRTDGNPATPGRHRKPREDADGRDDDEDPRAITATAPSTEDDGTGQVSSTGSARDPHSVRRTP
jgi:hypothetical protein